MALKQMVGRRFGQLTVLVRAPKTGQSHAWWVCFCAACGKSKDIRGQVLRRGDAKTCGCSQIGPKKRTPPTESELPLAVEGARWIKLTKGKFALIDAIDFVRVSCFNWSVAAGRYAARRDEHGALIYMHRFILDALPGQDVDHLNHDTLDNRRLNIRPATHQENCRHTRLRKNNTSGRKGVYFDKKRGVWRAEIRIAPKQKRYIGAFKSLDEAGRAYDIAAVSHFKAFAYTNTDVAVRR